MNISRVRVERYGPLRTDIEFGGGVQLVTGPNESGKTLLVEAVLEMLTGKSPSGSRVEESAAGFLVVSDESEETRLDVNRTLVDYYNETEGFDLTPAELRNVFVIRDADLQIRDSSFYESVTERITGLRTSEIRGLKEEVRDRGLLTPGCSLRNNQGNNKPKQQRDAAKELRGDVEEYLDSSEELESLESNLFDARRRERVLSARIGDIQSAREWEEIDSYEKTVGRLESALVERESLPDAEAVERLRSGLEGVSDVGGSHGELAGRKERWRSFALVGWVATVLSFLGFGLLGMPTIGIVVAVLSLLLTGVSTYMWLIASRRIGEHQRAKSEILDDARDVGITVESVDELRTEVGEIERERSESTRTIDQALGELRGLDIETDDPEAVIDRATEVLAGRRAALPDVEIEFSQSKLDEAEADLERVREKIDELEAALADHDEALRRFGDRTRRVKFEYFTGEPLDLEISNLEALELLVERLDSFVETIEGNAAVARDTHEILEAMEQSEGEKVERLFGDESRATSIFEAITDEAYETVRYEADEETIVVEHRQRGSLTPRELSRGACDQLYFCIRVALAEEILGGEPGFLLMDDALLASDAVRLERQVALLEELANDGWQVIYLTAKEDARATLEPVCTDEQIRLSRL